MALIESGTHVLFSAQVGGYRTGENSLAQDVVPQLAEGMLCLADRGFFSYEFWKLSASTGAELLWRIQKMIVLPCIQRLEDGSYLSKIYPSVKDRVRDRNGIDVRVVEYRLDGGCTR